MASMEPTQTPEYLAHWETLNNLEQAFSKFHNVREILQSAIDSYSPDETKDNLLAALSYFDWATTQYDSSHKKVWNTLKNLKNSEKIESQPNKDKPEHGESVYIVKKDILEVLNRPEAISKNHIIQSLKFLHPQTYEKLKSLDQIVENCLDDLVCEKKIMELGSEISFSPSVESEKLYSR